MIPGLVVGRFRLLDKLGAGGMGVVHRAVDHAGTWAAVKLIHPSLLHDPEFRVRFAREVDVLRRVGGLCTARVLDADPEAETPWLATEFVPGPTLEAQVLAEGPLRDESLYGLAAGLAESLSAMHAAGVIHRDLKPTNVILSPTGPKVIDFGIARILEQTAITRTGHVIGSPGWVSPEEYRGEEASSAADVHGWGLVVAYAALGEPVFGRGRPEVLAMRLLADVPDLSGLPDDLRDLVSRCLDKQPQDRPSAPGLLDEVAKLWCGRHEADVSSPVEDVTRLLRATWQPPLVSAAPEVAPLRVRRRHWPWVVACAVLVVGLVAAMLMVRPWQLTRTEIMRAAARWLAEVPALVLTGPGVEMTVTASRFRVGRYQQSDGWVQFLELPANVEGIPSGLLFKAGKSFYESRRFLIVRGEGSLEDPAFASLVKDFAGRWVAVSQPPRDLPETVRYTAFTPRLLADELFRGAWTTSTWEGKPVIRSVVKPAQRFDPEMTYYVSAASPYRLVAVGVGPLTLPVTETQTHARTLTEAGASLSEARAANLALPKTTVNAGCDVTGCGADVRVRGNLGASGTEVKMVTRLVNKDDHSEVLKICTRWNWAKGPGSEMHDYCFSDGAKYRSLMARHGRVTAVTWTVPLLLSADQVQTLLRRMV
ncbi:serine/threonine protein kinase [Nonomuraea sp. NPDC050556]|uniref:serine/threonine protein kinase n=1 Tax=Nonomuraea sp. NPDC050556 TaxID=3364369 RepID=UPI00378F673F